ncbi:MAG: double-strand break repair helicase AddA [Hyphomicrobiales bacterium]|nr:double-strand break repair helicase AddA [Hyphomicrobiales bacterium]MBV8825096.1 double-strand break repair helicase AddA [Hyphomicrobiales bacterium]MBV9429355.1 double-strand break repair helicase AddA [Bradyrhizobiaceae bacterium]
MNARVIPHAVKHVQIEASDPDASAWVAANAGSGKTHVLAQRVIRLMLDGADPAKILCLTFTKAAAATMANRIFDTLAKWIALDDDALDDAIEDLEGRAPSRSRRERARRLFAQALDTPGGLKVQTIHAFCTRMLHQFPFEADVAARFTVLEERAENDLLARLRLSVLLDAAAAPESPLGRALATAITVATDRSFAEAIDEAIRARDRLNAWVTHAGSIAKATAELSLLLGIGPNDTADQIEAAIVESPIMPAGEWAAAASLLRAGGTNDNERAKNLAAAAAATGTTRVDHYLQVFFNADETVRQRIVTKAVQTKAPDLAARLCEEQKRLAGLVARRRAVRARDRTAALITVADAVIRRYRIEKNRRGLLDYDDLIDKTLALMNKVDAAWVHYKLDLGIDHVLIDEAQDTSPKQWEIVKKLVEEFTAGEGARAVRRTIFAVGDEKQSIFSFQGAAPGEFAAARLHFQRAHRETEIEFLPCRFSHSFRSGSNVLGAVDRVFAAPEMFASITTDEGGIAHSALPDASPGLMEIWPLIEAEKRPEIEGWDAPFDTLSDENPQMKLARRIAAQVTASRARGCRAGDVLVLVRQRGPLFEAIIRTLKNTGIPVAGADRLVLTEHIAVMDLMVLADALLLPDDDLALATVLKSPLFGFDDAQLFEIAYGRTTSLRVALAGKPAFVETAARLDALAEAARRDTPFAFYARLLGAEGGRRKFLARLGSEAADALDEFLNFALVYETGEAPSLQGFVAWLRAATTVVKRDMDVAREEVRVMTVHGAKGLEAPIVILADTTTRPAGPRDPRLLALPRARVAPGTPDCLVWAGTMATDVGPIGEARERARAAAADEYRRLLYVAMTRTAEHLIVCGAQGLNGKPKNCWYDLVHDNLWEEAIEGPADHGGGAVRRWAKTPAGGRAAAPAAAPEPAIEIPKWLSRAAPAEAAVARAVSPSSAFEGVRPAAQLACGQTQRQALARGRIVHRLLQGLPDVAPDRRMTAARRHLAGAVDFSEAEREETIAEAMALLEDPVFGPLFAPGTRAEIPIVGRLARIGKTTLAVSGQIDRIAVLPGAILIADYKTDRPAPQRIEDVPKAYVTQLALYRAVLRQLYPDRELRAAVVWTELPALIELPADALDAALDALP